MKILLTTTSYQDTPGRHHDVLANSGFEVIRARGPLDESTMLRFIQQNNGFDGLLNGDDQITAQVIKMAQNAPTPLRVIAKYGIGLDSIDVDFATAQKIPVLFTPGVNHTTVAEHTFGLMVGVCKNFGFHLKATQVGNWSRQTGIELAGKTLGLLGLGRIGKEVAKRANAFGMNCISYSPRWDEEKAASVNVEKRASYGDVFAEADVISLHLSLSGETQHIINAESIERMKDGVVIINTGRGGLVDEQAIVQACRSGKLYGYGADVVTQEPMVKDHPFIGVDNILLTPHVGSRTNESVERQALRATMNIVNFLNGESDYIQANTVN